MYLPIKGWVNPDAKYAFKPDIAEAILEGVAEGRTARSVCKEHNFSIAVANYWFMNPNADSVAYNYPEKYANARLSGRAVWQEEAIDAAREIEEATKTVERTGGKFEGTEVTTYDNVERAKLKIGTINWMLERL